MAQGMSGTGAMPDSVWTRRRVLKRLGLGSLGVGLGLGGYAIGIEPHWIDFNAREMAIKNLPEQLTNKTLIQLSDLHIGPVVDDAYLVSVFQQVTLLKPDFVVVTGDFITMDSGRVPREQLMRNLVQLPRGAIGTFTVLGNHDFGKNWSEPSVAEEVASIITDAGITLLRNEVVESDGLLLAGVDDYWSPSFLPKLIATDIDPNAPTVLLCHNPDAMDADVWGSFQGWVLSGHTHGGQCRIPGCGAPIVPIRNKNYIAGEVDLGVQRRLYVNRGIGYLHRIRFAVRPEVTIFRLKAIPS